MSKYGWKSASAPESLGYIAPVIFRRIERLGDGKPLKIIDIGCGNGALCRSLIDQGHFVVGVEPDLEGAEIARQVCPEASFYNLSVSDSAHEIVVTHGLFDLVISSEVVEHLYYPRELPRFAAQLIREGGILLLTTPYQNYAKNLIISVLGRWDEVWNPLWDGGHIKFFSRMNITQLLNETGFDVVWFGGAGRLPYLWKSMVVEAAPRPL